MKCFYVDGGLGRIVSSIPAFLKYQKSHKEDEWYILIAGWKDVFSGIPELQQRTFDVDGQGVFSNIIKNCDEFVVAEPYRVPNFIKQKISMSESFDEIINETLYHDDLDYLTLKLSLGEKRKSREIIKGLKEEFGDKKTIVFQPYGSTAALDSELGVIDETNRSIPEKVYLKIVEILSEKYNILYFGDPNFQSPEDSWSNILQENLTFRQWMSIINECDYFIGCDSSGQHIARSLGKPGSVFFGGTDESNMSYTDYFHVVRKEGTERYPCTMRISFQETKNIERLTENSFDFTDDEIEEICNEIETHIESNS